MKRYHSVEDFQKQAKRVLPDPIYQYLIGGADSEWSVENNSSAFSSYQFQPSALSDVSRIDTSANILGVKIAAPIILSPTGMSRLFHREKELGASRAASSTGIYYALSTMATTTIEDVAKTGSGPKMFQIYIHKDRGLTEEFVNRAKAAGYQSLCLTVDTPVAGNRLRDKKTGFSLPPRMTPASFLSFARKPFRSLSLAFSSDLEMANVAHRVDVNSSGPLGVIGYVNDQFDKSITWDDAAMVIEQWGGPFAIKGIQTAVDAKRAVEIGASAAMISNHGGRQLDHTPAPVDCVKRMRDEVGSALELIVDGGVRSGADIAKAICLGADAVSIGRPYLYALASQGERGVEQLVDLLKDQLVRTMQLVGQSRLSGLGQESLFF